MNLFSRTLLIILITVTGTIWATDNDVTDDDVTDVLNDTSEPTITEAAPENATTTTDDNSNSTVLGNENDSLGVMVIFEPPWLYIVISIGGLIAFIVLLLLFYCLYQCIRRRFMRQKAPNKPKRDPKGFVDVILEYNYTQATLGLEVLQVRDLKFGKNQVEEKDLEVYCRVSLLPDDGHYQHTLTKAKTFNPVFNEQFYLRCLIDDLDHRQILIRVFRHFKFVRDAPIGDAVLVLSKTDLQLGFTSIPIITHNPALDDPLGQIYVTLRYNPATQKLGVTIIECKGLKSVGVTAINPYCKLTLKIGDKVIQKDKSHEVKKSKSPFFNVSFSYKINPTKLGLVDLLIQVKDRDLFGSGVEIGAIRFGVSPDSEKAEKQWENMIAELKQPQTEWHYLQPSTY